MRTFKSKTGYIKSLIDNVVYENNIIYLGIYDKEENYREEKNVRNTTERLELNKYCPRCRKHTTHKEKK